MQTVRKSLKKAPKRVVRNRHCKGCGAMYYRCNKRSAWVKQNPGSREGWIKREDAYCTHCQNEPIVRRLLMLDAKVKLAQHTLNQQVS